MEKIPDLMRAMLTQMARQFPDQDLIVVAYAPANRPLKIGRAHLDARTREMTYTPEK
jgi:predicted ribosome-associated RNA-binding protein Tma20